ncbi:MAG: LysM peptidoglycan-binding domain-containing protein [Candidatus Spechtbacterales bacterium]
MRIKNLLLLSKDKGSGVFYGLKKTDANSLFSFAWKSLAIFIFGGILVAGFRATEISTILPLHAAAEKSIPAEKNTRIDPTLGSQPFLNGRLIASIEIPAVQDQESGTGGAVYPSISTVQGVALLPTTAPIIPEPPSKDRAQIIEYIVKPYDTPSGIAAAYGLKLNTLLWSNHIDNPNLIHPGDKLFILPVDGLTYQVSNGDTLSRIASKFKADMGDILKYNDIESAQHIFPGQLLIIPGGVEPPASSSSSGRSSSSSSQYAYSSLPNLDGYFAMPVHGRITQGLHLKSGVDIGNKRGTPIMPRQAEQWA